MRIQFKPIDEKKKTAGPIDFVPITAKEAPAPKPGLFAGLKEDLAKRRANVATSIEQQSRGEHTGVETGLKLFGQSMGLIGDAERRVTAPFIERGVEMIPEPIKAAVTQSPLNKAAGSLLSRLFKGGADKYGEFATEHPRTADVIETVGNAAKAAPTIYAGGKALEAAITEGPNAVRSAVDAFSTKTQARAGAKESDKALDLTRPVLSKQEKADLIAKGKGTVSPVTKRYDIQPTPRDIERAETVKGIIAESKNDVDAISRLDREIGASARNLESAVESRNIIFNKNQLRTYLRNFMDSSERQILLSGDDAANKAYDGAVDTFMKIVDKHPKNNAGLLAARKEFDLTAQNGLKGVFGDGPLTAKKAAIRDIRRLANEFVADSLPEGDAMRDVLRRQTLMYEAKENIADKVVSKVGTNIFGRFEKTVREHPAVSTVVGGAAVTAGGVGVYKALK